MEQLLKANPQPDEKKGIYVVLWVKNGGKEKKIFASKLKEAKVPKLNQIAYFLLSSSTDDATEVYKGPDYLPRLEELYFRLRRELNTKNIFIFGLDKYLAQLSQG